MDLVRRCELASGATKRFAASPIFQEAIRTDVTADGQSLSTAPV